MIWQSIVTKIDGSETVTDVEVLANDGTESRMTAGGAFIYVGLSPKTAFLRGTVSFDSGGHVVTNARLQTSQRVEKVPHTKNWTITTVQQACYWAPLPVRQAWMVAAAPSNRSTLHDSGLFSTRWSVSGIFAAGDLRQYSARQIAASVGDGVTAAIWAERYLRGDGSP